MTVEDAEFLVAAELRRLWEAQERMRSRFAMPWQGVGAPRVRPRLFWLVSPAEKDAGIVWPRIIRVDWSSRWEVDWASLGCGRCGRDWLLSYKDLAHHPGCPSCIRGCPTSLPRLPCLINKELPGALVRRVRARPGSVLRMVRRLQAAASWCEAREQGCLRAVEEVRRQWQAVSEALAAEVALARLR